MTVPPVVAVELVPVDRGTWRACAELDVREDQRRFVAPVTRYLALCAYDDGPWSPFAAMVDGVVVGFGMSGIDPADGSFWIGGLVVDAAHQGRGVGRAMLVRLIEQARAESHASVALSYSPENVAARGLYLSLGFVETGEHEDDEVVARLSLR